jgi:hypothetical protein
MLSSYVGQQGVDVWMEPIPKTAKRCGILYLCLVPWRGPSCSYRLVKNLWKGSLSIISRLERGGPCWVLKLRWMHGDSKEYKWKGSFLSWFVRLVVPRDFYWALVGTVKLVPNRILFQFLCPDRFKRSWAGSRAGSPVFKYLSLMHHSEG